MNVLLVLLSFTGIAFIDLPQIIKQKQWRNLAIYLLLFLLVLAIGLAMALGVKIPSPIEAAQKFYYEVLHWTFKLPDE